MTIAAARPHITAAELILSEQGHVLIVKHSYKAPLGLPGGIVSPGELPRVACAREILEELAIRPSIGQLLVIDWAPHSAEGDRLVFIFDAGTLTRRAEAAIRID
jgi:8-oxo-dGTP diphosphatase